MNHRQQKTKTTGSRLLHWLHDHLLPHKRNGHTPRALHHGPLFSYSVLIIVLKVFALAVTAAIPSASLMSAAITANNIVALTNQTRRSVALPELIIDPKLSAAAQAKADDMLAKGYFSHIGPDGSAPWDWFEQYDYLYRSAGENLAANFTNAEDVTSGWLASPAHYDNIVSDRFAEIGVGVAQGIYENYPTTFVVQMFGYELNGEIADSQPITTVDELSDNSAPILDETQTVIVPSNNSYQVTVTLTNTDQAMIYLGDYSVPLIEEEESIWRATMPYNPATLDPTGESLILIADGLNEVHLVRNLAWVMPDAGASDVYAFGTPSSRLPKLMGVVDITNIDKNVTQFYLYLVIALGSLLLLALILKFKHQKPRVAAHVLVVISLAFILTLI